MTAAPQSFTALLAADVERAFGQPDPPWQMCKCCPWTGDMDDVLKLPESESRCPMCGELTMDDRRQVVA